MLQSEAKSAVWRFEACGWLNYTHHTMHHDKQETETLKTVYVE